MLGTDRRREDVGLFAKRPGRGAVDPAPDQGPQDWENPVDRSA